MKLTERLKWWYHYKMVSLGARFLRDWNVRCETCRCPKYWNFIQYFGGLHWKVWCYDCGMKFNQGIIDQAKRKN